MKYSIRYKIYLIIAALILLFFPILFVYFPGKQEKLLTESYEKEVLGIARTVSLGVRIALSEHNFEGVQTAMNYARNDSRMIFVALYKLDSTGKKSLMSSIPSSVDPVSVTRKKGESIVIKSDTINLSVFKGEVSVAYSADEIKQQIKKATRTTFWLSGIVTLIGILIGFYVSRIITKPISMLITTTKRITIGDLSLRALRQSNDEIGELSDSFNFMIEKLQENTQKLELQSRELGTKNRLITDSINYSRRIQQVLLYNETDLRACFSDSFVLFKAKDIVSGDFLWVKRTEKYSFVALVDCTGHGVPGAMMSIIGHFILNHIYQTTEAPTPGEILEKLNYNMRKLLKQETHDASDGMDLALCRFDNKTGEIIFAGANRNLYLYLNNTEVVEYKGERKGIGGKPPKSDKFTDHIIRANPGNWIVAYTDGIQDQFGTRNTKFGKSGVNKGLLNTYDKTADEISSALNRQLEMHQGAQPQTDDILLIGIRI